MRNCVAVEKVFALAALYPVRIIGDREERNKEDVEVRPATAFSICGRYAATWTVKLSVLTNGLKSRCPSENDHRECWGRGLSNANYSDTGADRYR